MGDNLGDFEQLVMLAVMRLDDDAYGTSIREELKTRAEREVSPGAIFTTLERLESRGLVTSRYGEPTRRTRRPQQTLLQTERRGPARAGALAQGGAAHDAGPRAEAGAIMSASHPPRIAERLLQPLLDDRSRDAVLGDLHEGYVAVRQQRGARGRGAVVLGAGGAFRDRLPHHRPAAARCAALRLRRRSRAFSRARSAAPGLQAVQGSAALRDRVVRDAGAGDWRRLRQLHAREARVHRSAAVPRRPRAGVAAHRRRWHDVARSRRTFSRICARARPPLVQLDARSGPRRHLHSHDDAPRTSASAPSTSITSRCSA